MLVLKNNMVIHSDTLTCICRFENFYLAIKVYSFFCFLLTGYCLMIFVDVKPDDGFV